MNLSTTITLGCVSIVQGLAYGQDGTIDWNTNTQLPPLSVSLQSNFTPSEDAAGSWNLNYTEWRSASPESNVQYFGHSSTSNGGWEEFEFSSWSDDPSEIDPSVDPHMEIIFNDPSLWDALDFFNTQPYTVISMDINISLCIDEGCIQTVPESIVFDSTNALYIMEETIATAKIPPKTIRTATLESGVAGQALADSLRAEGKTDKQIDSEYPGLLVPADYYYVAPAVITTAYFNPFVYTVYNDEGLVVAGEEMILFLESKNAPEQLIYEIVNGLPLSPTPSYLLNGDEGGPDHDYKDITIDVEVTGGAEVSTTMGVTTVKVNGEVKIKLGGNVGQLQDGGEALANQVAKTFEKALNTVVETAEENANSGPSVSLKVTLAAVNVVVWFSGWFN